MLMRRLSIIPCRTKSICNFMTGWRWLTKKNYKSLKHPIYSRLWLLIRWRWKSWILLAKARFLRTLIYTDSSLGYILLSNAQLRTLTKKLRKLLVPFKRIQSQNLPREDSGRKKRRKAAAHNLRIPALYSNISRGTSKKWRTCSRFQ